jgi:hypothetical protein
LLAFVDPRLTGKEGHPVWLPQTGATALHFDTVSLDAPTADRPGLLIPTLPNVEHILLDSAGRQYVILRSRLMCLQLIITGSDGIIAPTILALRLHRRDDIELVSEALATLDSLLSAPAGLVSTPPGWTAETERLRNALIALDCDRAGLTLRETAVVIYGRQRVDRDWPGKGLRDRMRRSRQRGLALCNGGYRDLLR